MDLEHLLYKVFNEIDLIKIEFEATDLCSNVVALFFVFTIRFPGEKNPDNSGIPRKVSKNRPKTISAKVQTQILLIDWILPSG